MIAGAIFGHSGQAGADSIISLNLEWFSGNTEGRGGRICRYSKMLQKKVC